MDIGIDLGTTYSVIAVYGRVATEGNYPAAQYQEECNATIIPSHVGEFTIPSAFWQDPNDPKKIIVGTDAKELSKSGEMPILFSKRSIGTTQKLLINDTAFNAADVATHILRYLKRCAEDALGAPVRRAVITHPAYFTPNQVEETRAAAVAAGLDMSLPEQMLMEPVAAAYAYISQDSREGLRVLTYDLGGGTFDVTVLERRDGLVKMLSFGGNPLLGGYNFDTRLAAWIVSQAREFLKQTKRQLVLDENKPEDQVRWTRLLQLAELVKYELYNSPTSKVRVPVKANGILVDTDGSPIAFLDRLSRDEYQALIQDLLDETVMRSYGAIEEAGLQPADIDEIVLVGGSSYGQWVRETVSKAFPAAKIQLYSPDLAVALGAAIYANAELPPLSAQGPAAEFKIVLDVRTRSPEQIIHIPGSIGGPDGSSLSREAREKLSVELEMLPSQSGSQGERIGPIGLSESGAFLFRDVELLDGTATEMVARVIDADGRARVEQPFSIEYARNSDDIVQFKVLSKPIFLKTGSGLITIAKQADPLPVRSKPIPLIKIHDDTALDLPVYQGDEHVTTILVEGIPADAGAGSTVLMTVEITKDNVMQGKVEVKRKDGTIATEWPFKVSFPPRQIPSLAELEQAYKHLEAKRVNLLENEQDPGRRVLLGGKGAKLSEKLKALLAQDFRNAQEIHQGIEQLDALIAPQRDEMLPPLGEFDAIIKECEKEIAEGEAKDAQPRLERLEKIAQQGHDAFNLKNVRKWKAAWSLLKSFQGSLHPEDDSDRELPETPALKDHAYNQVVVECGAAMTAKRRLVEFEDNYMTTYAPRFKAIEDMIAEQQKRINAIDDSMKPEDAIGKLQPIWTNEKARIMKRIEESIEHTYASASRRGV